MEKAGSSETRLSHLPQPICHLLKNIYTNAMLVLARQLPPLSHRTTYSVRFHILWVSYLIMSKPDVAHKLIHLRQSVGSIVGTQCSQCLVGCFCAFPSSNHALYQQSAAPTNEISSLHLDILPPFFCRRLYARAFLQSELSQVNQVLCRLEQSSYLWGCEMPRKHTG
jgi:hypothetical protein